MDLKKTTHGQLVQSPVEDNCNLLQTTAPMAPSSKKTPVAPHDASVFRLFGVIALWQKSGLDDRGMTKAIAMSIKDAVSPMLK